MSRRRQTGFVVLLALSLAGCGYEFGTTVKPGAARGLHLAVPVFHNDTFEPVVDKRVTEIVRRQFLQADGLTLVNDAGSAPFAVKGRVLGYGARSAEMVDQAVVRRLWDEHQGGGAEHGMKLWTLLTFERWLRRLDAPGLTPPRADPVVAA